MVNVRIFVTYKQSVFDPQGETIKDAIHSLGHDEVTAVKVGKFFDVTLDTNEGEVATAVKKLLISSLLISIWKLIHTKLWRKPR